MDKEAARAARAGRAAFFLRGEALAGCNGGMPEDDDVVTVGEYSQVHEAYAAAGYLEANGLEVLVSGSPLGIHYGAYTGQTRGEFRLQVKRMDAEAAVHLLANPEPLADDFDPGQE
jgi:hypothetical protein